jgi:predicted nucleic acid-binding protein
MSHLWNMRAGRLSYQVLQEFYITVTEKLDPGLDREGARKDIRSLLPWRPISVDNRVFDGAWHIQDRFGLSWWDALIVSAAQVADCRYLLTEDLQDSQIFGNLQVINPFHMAPETLEL